MTEDSGTSVYINEISSHIEDASSYDPLSVQLAGKFLESLPDHVGQQLFRLETISAEDVWSGGDTLTTNSLNDMMASMQDRLNSLAPSASDSASLSSSPQNKRSSIESRLKPSLATTLTKTTGRGRQVGATGMVSPTKTIQGKVLIPKSPSIASTSSRAKSPSAIPSTRDVGHSATSSIEESGRSQSASALSRTPKREASSSSMMPTRTAEHRSAVPSSRTSITAKSTHGSAPVRSVTPSGTKPSVTTPSSTAKVPHVSTPVRSVTPSGTKPSVTTPSSTAKVPHVSTPARPATPSGTKPSRSNTFAVNGIAPAPTAGASHSRIPTTTSRASSVKGNNLRVSLTKLPHGTNTTNADKSIKSFSRIVEESHDLSTLDSKVSHKTAVSSHVLSRGSGELKPSSPPQKTARSSSLADSGKPASPPSKNLSSALAITVSVETVGNSSDDVVSIERSSPSAQSRQSGRSPQTVILHPSAVLVQCKPPDQYMPPLCHSSQSAINAIYCSAPNSALNTGALMTGFVKAQLRHS